MRSEYDRLVNAKWQALDHETVFAVDMVTVEKFLRAGWLAHMKTPFIYKVKETSGNRQTWCRGLVFYVNPADGWKEISHSLSHWITYKKGWKDHGEEHLRCERDLTNLAIEKFVGKAPPPEKPKPDAAWRRYEKVLDGIDRWEKKLSRAQNALAKLRKQQKYYERKL